MHVEALRSDIERFQEGRSVSAKADTYRELAWKLAKRNKLATVFTHPRRIEIVRALKALAPLFGKAYLS